MYTVTPADLRTLLLDLFSHRRGSQGSDSSAIWHVGRDGAGCWRPHFPSFPGAPLPLPHSRLSSPHRQLLKTELGSFFTEYLQVGGRALQPGWGCFLSWLGDWGSPTSGRPTEP